MFTTEEFRTRIYSYYEENGIVVGDPSAGSWENAHIVPRCVGGTETVLLLYGHHIMHDLYQSREYNHQCFHGRTKTWLYGEGFLCEHWFELVELYEYYSSRHGAQNAAARWAAMTPDEKSVCGRSLVEGRWAAMTPEERLVATAPTRASVKARWATLTPEERSAEMSRRLNVRWAKVRAERAVRSLGADLHGAMWADEVV